MEIYVKGELIATHEGPSAIFTNLDVWASNPGYHNPANGKIRNFKFCDNI